MACDGLQYGPDVTFLGVPRCTWDEPATDVGVDVVILGAPFDGCAATGPNRRRWRGWPRRGCADHAEITSALANRMVLEALSGIARRRRDAAEGSTWDPRPPLLDGR